MTRAEGERGASPSTKLAFTKKVRRQARFLRAVSRTGYIQAGCREAGVSWNQAMDWLKDPEFMEYYLGARDKFLDTLKGRLYAKASEGHASSLHILLRLTKQEQDATR